MEPLDIQLQTLFMEWLCLQYYKFMGHSEVKPTLEEKYAGQVPDVPAPAAVPQVRGPFPTGQNGAQPTAASQS